MGSSANTPGEASLEDFYDTSPLEANQLYQGEILADVPILTMHKPTRWLLLRTRTGRRVDDALEQGNLGGTVKVLDSNQSKEQWYADGLGDFAMAVLDKRSVLVLNQTCDVQTKDFLQVAPIYPHESDAETLESLRRGDIYSAYWLKAHHPEIPQDSFADLEHIQAVHKSYLRRIRPEQHFRLRPDRIRELQRFITRYFGRPNSFDARTDTAPRSGRYLCVACFYMDARVTFVDVSEGSPFAACGTCHGTQWVLKGH